MRFEPDFPAARPANARLAGDAAQSDREGAVDPRFAQMSAADRRAVAARAPSALAAQT